MRVRLLEVRQGNKGQDPKRGIFSIKKVSTDSDSKLLRNWGEEKNGR